MTDATRHHDDEAVVSASDQNAFPPRRVAILGVGLLGGSVAHSLRRRLPEITIVGTGRTEEKRQHLLRSGAVDVAVESVQHACRGCDVVVVATPVDRIAQLVIQAAEVSPPHCLITDVGSTKTSIVNAVNRVPDAAQKFIAAHPIAGSEKTGVAHARENLFDGKTIILTPGEMTSPTLTDQCDRFWQLTGGRTIRMVPEDHDRYLATVSHVPHLVSAVVARMAGQPARLLVGSGWRDITRVAAGDPALWTAICRENRSAIRRELARVGEEITKLQSCLADADDEALQQWLAEAQKIRQQVDADSTGSHQAPSE